jgi:hypothetical protein
MEILVDFGAEADAMWKRMVRAGDDPTRERPTNRNRSAARSEFEPDLFWWCLLSGV